MAGFEGDLVEYYYVVYISQGFGGCIVIPQTKLPSGESSPDGFNIAQAHQYLFSVLGAPVVIQSYHVITRKRREEFELFVQNVTRGVSSEHKKHGHLSLVVDNGEKKT